MYAYWYVCTRIASSPPSGIFSQHLLFERAAAGKPGFHLMVVDHVYCISIHMYAYWYVCTTIPSSPPSGILSQHLLFERAAAGKPGFHLMIVDHVYCRCPYICVNIGVYALEYRSSPPSGISLAAPAVRARRRGQARLPPDDCGPRHGRGNERRRADQNHTQSTAQ